MTEAQIFNRLYPIGTPVIVDRANNEPFGPFQTVTASEAKPVGFDTAFILVAGIVEPVNLSTVKVDFKRAPNLQGRTIEQAEAEDAAREAQQQAASKARKAALVAAQEAADKADAEADQAAIRLQAAERLHAQATTEAAAARAAAAAAHDLVDQLHKA